ncbi:MAG: FAD-dependent oxidoreductase, partial [Nitrospirota bacterium]|nr:FAD-dependent oxidoreductase [Nitrospirota bacterium]
EIKALVEGLLEGRLERHVRRSFIYSHRTYTEYPFQVNTYGLPPEVVRDCLLGFIATLAKPSGEAAKEPSFKAWILDNLGEGIARHFMVPFNEKLWQVPLDELTSDWVSWLIPKPDIKDVINGALGIKDKAFGYNPTFLYPKRGGIDALPKAFLPRVPDIQYGTELVELDTQRRRATVRTGQNGSRVLEYEKLVSTIPIPELVKRCTDVPRDLREAAEGLRCVSVYSVNLGVARERVTDMHWIYFPEPDYPFYRAGFPMNFSPGLGPSGCSSLYVEISHQPTEALASDDVLKRVRGGLERAGIFTAKDELVAADVRDIRYAYVLFDRHRARALPAILQELERRGIHSIGRYGRWEHTSMEDAIGQGKQLAEQLNRQGDLAQSGPRPATATVGRAGANP